MEEAKRIAVTIVAWNHLEVLQKLCASLEDQERDDCTVTVVDNASGDGTAQWLRDHEPGVTVLRNFRNQGFARAQNQAIELALSRWAADVWPRRYILVVNPDVELAPDCLRLLVERMEVEPTLAVCGPKLLRARICGCEDGRLETERTRTIDSMGLAFLPSRRVIDRGSGEEDHGQYDTKTKVFGISGACALFRASALATAKLAGEFFDEDFFAYKEDADLAWRLRLLGATAACVPDALAWHHRRVPSLPTKSLFVLWRARGARAPLINTLSTRNHLWMLVKNETCASAWRHAHRIALYECAKLFASLFSLSAIRGYLAALGGLRKMWKKRRELRARSCVSGSAMRAWFV